MRAARVVPVAVVAIFAVIAVACVLPARLFSITIPAGPATKQLAVTLEDRTGLVQALGRAQPGQFNLEEGVGAPDKPDVLVVSWTGGSCDLEAHVVFSGTGGGYLMTVTTERNPGFCDLAGVLRTVSLGLSSPVDPSLVRLDVDHGG